MLTVEPDFTCRTLCTIYFGVGMQRLGALLSRRLHTYF